MPDTFSQVDFRDYMRVLRKRLGLIVLIVAVTVLATGLLTYKVLHKSYTAQATLMVILSGSEASTTATNQSVYLLEQSIGQTYADMATSGSVLKAAGLPLTAARHIAATAVPGADLLTLRVTAPSAVQAANKANRLATALIAKVTHVVKVRDLRVTDPATPPPLPASPRPKLDMAIAAGFGLLFAIALAFLLEYMDTTFHNEEDLRRALDLPVLGVIPFIEPSRQRVTRAMGPRRTEA